ncbi:hypothetical protein BDK92_6665 [Micromonospora pisi]|uniref:Uncharacterized protein n=1 Tax=Micromonospora pisi TaxID=589240 RepID=A0A495JVQ0_9ACTN|nr:hypothetical protein BDK92_6665 [Micromonospora pisi]
MPAAMPGLPVVVMSQSEPGLIPELDMPQEGRCTHSVTGSLHRKNQ